MSEVPLQGKHGFPVRQNPKVLPVLKKEKSVCKKHEREVCLECEQAQNHLPEKQLFKTKQNVSLLKKGMLCSSCKKKLVKWTIGEKDSIVYYGFCSKVCIANNTIRHYKMKKVRNNE